jgi:hypothetical protein
METVQQHSREENDAAYDRWLRECLSPEEAATKAQMDNLDNIHDELQQQLAELAELQSEDVPELMKAVWLQIHANRDEWANVALKNLDALSKRIMETSSEQKRKW